MSATKAGGRKKHEEEHEEHENEERWLVSFADMMTLLFCLFMVLFAISSVNTSKFESLKKSLSESFDGQILSGGKSVMQTGATSKTERASAEPATPALMPRQAVAASFADAKKDRASEAAKAEEESFKRLKKRIDADAKKFGLTGKVKTTIRKRGLVVRLLTDGVLFDSGQATLKPQSEPILADLGGILAEQGRQPIVVEGYTDNQPIGSAQFPTNWELSGARASSVVRHFISDGVPVTRLSAMHFAQQHPIATNATTEGRATNRRVEIVLTRLNQTPAQGGAAP